MSLTIGQVSQLFKLSSETIRYYEKEGLIHPRRKEGSTYRTYSSWDIFDLAECLRYRNMDFSLKETKNMMKHDDLKLIEETYASKIEIIKKDIAEKQIVLQSLKENYEKIKNASLNVGNYWFKTEHEKVCVKCTTGQKEEYADFDYTNHTLSKWFWKNPMLRVFIQFPGTPARWKNDENDWFFGIDKEYFDMLDLPLEGTFSIPAQRYLHTIIDMGERGQLSLKRLESVFEHIRSRNLMIGGDILGEMLVRFYENHKWRRLVDIMVPVKNSG